MKRIDLQHNLAMTVVLVSMTMLFATLFLGYAIYRSNATLWPTLSVFEVNFAYPIASSIIMLISHYFCYATKLNVMKSEFQAAHRNLNITLVLGFAFIFSQFKLWAHLKDCGIFVDTGVFSSIIYGFTWIHTFHMVAGICCLFYLKFILLKQIKPVNLLRITGNMEKFWHFLGIVWLVMFLVLFIF